MTILARFMAVGLVLLLTGCVNTPGKFLDAKNIFTAAPQTDAYRGAGGVFRNDVNSADDAIVGESTITQLSAGFQLGGQAYSQIIFFEDQRAFDEFCSGTYEFGAKATAVALTASASAQTATDGSSTSRSTRSNDASLTGGYHKGAAVFTITKGGVLYEASIGGQKFSTKC